MFCMLPCKFRSFHRGQFVGFFKAVATFNLYGRSTHLLLSSNFGDGDLCTSTSTGESLRIRGSVSLGSCWSSSSSSKSSSSPFGSRCCSGGKSSAEGGEIGSAGSASSGCALESSSSNAGSPPSAVGVWQSRGGERVLSLTPEKEGDGL